MRDLFILTGFLYLISCSRVSQAPSPVPVQSDIHIRLSEAQLQLANIKVTEATEGVLTQHLLLSGVVKVNELSSVTVSSRARGRIQKLFLKNTGEYVKKGDPLYDLYSDDMVAAEREYFTLESNNYNFTKRYEPSLQLENKLLLMGMLQSQIKEIGKTGKILYVVTILSPASGTIRSIKVSEGQYVDVGTQLYELADEGKLWIEAQAYPDELQFLETGMPAEVTIPVAGDMHFKSSVSFINPAFEAGRNVTIIRAVINNPGKKIHPGMFATLSVPVQKSKAIIIPSSAVITDKNGSQVWTMEEDKSYSARMVKTGIHSNDSVSILSGINKSQKIVFSGAYLLYSEMILKNGTVAME